MTKPDLLDRYIRSIKALLPPDKRDDIAAEINSNLQSMIDDRPELSLDELSAILKQHGHPRVVARRYGHRPGQALIGPELFPFYWSTLRAILVVWVIGAVCAFRGTASVASILLCGFLMAAGVTAVFAAWEYLALPFPYAQRWKPERLPPVIAQPRIKQPQPIVGLFFLGMALVWPALFWVWNRAGIFTPSATVYAMRLPLLLLASLWIAQLRIAANIAGWVCALVLLCQGDLLLAGPHMTLAQGAALEALNRFFAGLLVVSCISSGFQCLRSPLWGRLQSAADC